MPKSQNIWYCYLICGITVSSTISIDCRVSKDVEKCIQLIKEVLMESQKPWKMVESPLYYRYVDTVHGKSFSGVGNNFVRALATEIENKEEYEFLKGNKELEAIFSQYLK